MKLCGYCLEPVDDNDYCVNQQCYRNKITLTKNKKGE